MENPQGEDTEFTRTHARRSVQMFQTWQRQRDERLVLRWLPVIIKEIQVCANQGIVELTFNSRTQFNQPCWGELAHDECGCLCCSCILLFKLCNPEKMNKRVMLMIRDELRSKGFTANIASNRWPEFSTVKVQW